MATSAYLFIYIYPAIAKFPTPKEREYVLTRLRNVGDATRDEKFTSTGVLKVFKDPKIYLLGLCYHTTNLPGYTLIIFLPTINGLSYTATQAQLLLIPLYNTRLASSQPWVLRF